MSSKTCFAKSSCIVLASALFCTSLPALATSSTAGTNLAVQQQDQKLKGQVIDATTGEPVIGVNVLVKGSTNGTITDIDGKYELNAPAGAILQISFIGYKTVEIAAQWKFSGDKHKSLQVYTERTFHQRYLLVML